MAASNTSIITCYVLNILVSILCFLIFSCLRKAKSTKKYFAPRRYAPDIRLRPRQLPDTGLLSWIKPVWTYPEAELIDELGLDAAMFLRMLKFGFYLFAGVAFWCLAAVLPLHITADEIAIIEATTTDTSFVSFDKCSLSNISPGSARMWMHTVSVYVITFYALWLLKRYNQDSVELRVMYLARARPGGASHTVLVTDIPGIAGVRESDKAADAKTGDTPTSKHARDSATEQAGRGQRASGATAGDSANKKAAAAPTPTKAASAAATPATMPSPQRKSQVAPLPASPSASALPSPSPSAGKLGAKPLLPPISKGSPGSPASSEQPKAAAAAAPASAKPAPEQKAAAAAVAEGRVTSPGRQRAPSALSTPVCEGSNEWLALSTGRRVSDTGAIKNGAIASVSARTLRVGVQQPAALVTPHPTMGPVAEGSEDPKRDSKRDAAAEALLADSQAAAGVVVHDGQPAEGPRRRHAYQLRGSWLDPVARAERLLATGMTAKGMISAEFSGVYPDGGVVGVATVNDQLPLEPLLKEFDKLRLTLDDYLDECNFKMAQGVHVERKIITVYGSKGAWGQARGYRWRNKLDAIEYWTARLTELSRLISEQQAESRVHYTPSAFVTLDSRVKQCSAAASLQYSDETVWLTRSAPEANELVWKNLGMKRDDRIFWGRMMILIFCLMTAFFIIPVAALQAMINLDNLAKNPLLGKIVNLPVIRQLLQALLPGIVLIIFLALVPMILAWFMRLSGSISLSEVDNGVITRFFIFQVVVVFFYNVICGSLVSSMQQWINNPTDAINILGTSIPTVSTFFITYILIKGVAGASIGLLRVVGLALLWIFTMLAKGPKAQLRLWSEQYSSYGAAVAPHTIILMLGVVYSLINPIITPTVLLYFLLNVLIHSYQVIYVYRKRYESCGGMWSSIFGQVMFSLYLFQICMIALLGIKKFPYAVLIVPAPILTAAFHYSTLSLLARPWTLTAAFHVAELDRREKAQQAAAGGKKVGGSGKGSAAADGDAVALAIRSDPLNSEWIDTYEVDTMVAFENADGPAEVPEPVEVAYLSRAFKLNASSDLEGLFAETKEVDGRLASQPPPPTKEELKARKRAAKETDKKREDEERDAPV